MHYYIDILYTYVLWSQEISKFYSKIISFVKHMIFVIIARMNIRSNGNQIGFHQDSQVLFLFVVLSIFPSSNISCSSQVNLNYVYTSVTPVEETRSDMADSKVSVYKRYI